MDVTFLQKNYTFVLVAVTISIFLTFLLNLALPQNKQERSYIKSTIITCVISALAIYIHELDPFIENISLEPPPF